MLNNRSYPSGQRKRGRVESSQTNASQLHKVLDFMGSNPIDLITKGNTMKYRKKPVVIDALKWDGSQKSTKEVLEFIGQKVDLTHNSTQERFSEYCNHVSRNGLTIPTLEGKHIASVGDFIIKGVKGEYYPCKPDIHYDLRESNIVGTNPVGACCTLIASMVATYYLKTTRR